MQKWSQARKPWISRFLRQLSLDLIFNITNIFFECYSFQCWGSYLKAFQSRTCKKVSPFVGKDMSQSQLVFLFESQSRMKVKMVKWFHKKWTESIWCISVMILLWFFYLNKGFYDNSQALDFYGYESHKIIQINKFSSNK